MAVPAAAASLAYLNARTGFLQDVHVLQAVVAATLSATKTFKKQRANVFYDLERHALSRSTANKAFIVVPPHIPKDCTPESIKTLRAEEYTYREVYDRVLKYAGWLKQEHGIAKGDIVALDCTNKPLFVFLWMALASLGARPAFINTGLSGQSLLHCIRTSSARVLLLDSQLQDVLSDEVRSDLKGDSEKKAVDVSVVDDETQSRIESLAGFRADDVDRILDPLDMALLIFTSGTTVSISPITELSRIPRLTVIGDAKSRHVKLAKTSYESGIHLPPHPTISQ